MVVHLLSVGISTLGGLKGGNKFYKSNYIPATNFLKLTLVMLTRLRMTLFENDDNYLSLAISPKKIISTLRHLAEYKV